MRPSPDHWSEAIRTHLVAFALSGNVDVLPIILDGGAENGSFPYISGVRTDEVMYDQTSALEHIQPEDILLEIQGKSVGGFTLYDVTQWLVQCSQGGNRVQIRTVRPGKLTRDLRQFLAMRFPKGSVDHELQNTVRDNVYLRTVPCTTRQPRPGETDGVDYRFVNVDEFMKLDRSGELLESGIFEGNYYGTPKPPKSLPTVTGTVPSTSTSASSVLAAIEAKRGLRGKNGDDSGLAGTPPLVNGRVNGYPPHMHNNHNGGSFNQYFDGNGTDGLGHLPPNWEMALTEVGEPYFIDHNTGTTHWTDPRLLKNVHAAGQRPSVSDSLASGGSDLPPGWEKIEDPQYGVYYVDHVNKRTQYEKPLMNGSQVSRDGANGGSTSASTNGARRVVTQSRSMPFIHPPAPEGDRYMYFFPGDNPHRGLFTRDPSQLRGDMITAKLLKGPKGLGFTLIGNDGSSAEEEFLQLKSVIIGGAAHRDGRLRTGDILVSINDTCVLGYSQEQVIRLFQSIPVGQYISIQCNRGYPLLFDPQDPSNEILTMDAYSDQSELSESGGSGQGVKSNTNTMSDLFPSHLQAERLIVHITKGALGFGFTIADSPFGQKVKQILDRQRCSNLLDGDILCRINTRDVSRMSHAEIVDVLHDFAVGQEVAVEVLRGGTLRKAPINGTGPAKPPPVAAKPSRPHSAFFGNHIGQSDPLGRRAKTPTNEMMGHIPGQAPIVKPRSKTPGPFASAISQASMPPRPPANHKPNGYLPQQQQQRDTSFRDREEGRIYENFQNLNTRDRSKSPAMRQQQSRSNQRQNSGAFAAATPNFVPVSMYRASPSTSMNNSFEPNAHMSHDGYQLITVNLMRTHQGFGFRIVGGCEEGTQVSVGNIVADGAAARDGRLQLNDEIIEVDNQNVFNASHGTVIQLIERASAVGHVKLVVRRREMARSISMPLPKRQIVGTGAFSVAARYPYDVTVVRREDEGFGFVIISSVNKSGSAIGRIIPNSPAERCQQLNVGDRIVAVNGINILAMHHGDIVNLIKDSGYMVTLTVGSPQEQEFAMEQQRTLPPPPPAMQHHDPFLLSSYLEPPPVFESSHSHSAESVHTLTELDDIDAHEQTGPVASLPATVTYDSRVLAAAQRSRMPTQYHVAQANPFATQQPPLPQSNNLSETFVVDLQRGSKGYGFSIRGGKEFQNMPLFVLRIAEGGPAHVDGKLQVGDQILEINGKSAEGMTHAEAIEIIKREPLVRLLVRRDGAPMPPGTAPLATIS